MSVKIAFTISLLSAPLVVADPLPNTQPIDWEEENLSERLMDGAHRFVEAAISAAAESRTDQPDRDHFRAMLGVAEERISPVHMERFGDVDLPNEIGNIDGHLIYQVRWPIFEDLHGEGLLVAPFSEPEGVFIAFPEIDQTPEECLAAIETFKP
ncbi:MAG: hypothetical protein AAF585_21775, partial [Verrucomicrobiota bacterium]